MTEKNTIKITKGEETLELEVRIDVPAMRRLRRYEPSINIYNLVNTDKPETSLWAQMLEDPGIAVDVCYEGTRHDAKRAGMKPEEFAEGLAGDALDACVKAAIRGIVDFTPSRQGRELLNRILTHSDAAAKAMADQVEAKLQSGEIDSAIKEAVEEATTPKPKPKSKGRAKTTGGSTSSTGDSA